jgi:iron complex outermembrane receptor protein
VTPDDRSRPSATLARQLDCPGRSLPDARRGPDPRIGPHRLAPIAAAVIAALQGMPARADDAATDPPTHLQAVMVTATRHEASAQDLPLSITAITGNQLQQEGIGDISQLAHSLAGVNFTDKGPFGGVNGSTLIIRGLNSEATAGQLALATPIVPPVSIYVDNTPLFVNLRLDDLQRVEILRGPQGTLYGSGSLGGTIRFVQNPPDPKAFDARAEVGMSDTAHTHAANEEAHGMLNVPLGDTLAVRINASWSDQAGFIDQPDLYRLDASGAPLLADPGQPITSAPVVYSQKGTNDYAYKAARISTLWRPSDSFQAQLSYYHQLSTASGFPYSSVLLGIDHLESTDHTRASANDAVDVGSLSLDYDFGFATLTSNTSWSRHDNRSSGDLTDLYDDFSFYPSLYGANPRVLVTGHDELYDEPWTEELRLASPTDGTLEWVMGLFYQNEKTDIREHEFYPGYLDYFNACAPVYGVSAGDGVTPSQCGIGETVYSANPINSVDGIPIIKDQAYIGDFETRFKDIALFGDVTAKLTPAWSVTAGARVFKQTLSQAQQTGLLFDGPGSIDNNSLNDDWRRALWKLNTAYRLTKATLVYATWSQGFRRGSVNALPPTEPAVSYVTDPRLYKVSPDKADNYEVGVKGAFDDWLSYSADVFDIQWHNVQEGAQLTPLVLPGAINVGNAYSRGFETELYASITDNLSGTVDYTYDLTRLTSLTPYAVAGLAVPPPAVGAPLPGTPKNSLAVGLDYGLALGPGRLHYRADAHYQSSVVPALSASIPTVAGYTLLDLRLAYDLPHWQLALYCDNVTDNRGVDSYEDPFNYSVHYQALVSRPRTIGVTVAYSLR